MVEGSRLYNSFPRRITEYDGSYLGFKNCIDKWIDVIPDKPREVGNEPLGRNRDGKPSNSLRDWSKVNEFCKYDDSWVPIRKQKLVISDVITQSDGGMMVDVTEIYTDVILLGPRIEGSHGR